MAYSAKEKLIKLHEIVQNEEERRTEFSQNCMEKNNTLGMLIHNAEASMCTKIRWTLDGMIYRNGETPEWESMEFNEAYDYLRKGKKIKLPEWNGYWYWSDDRKTIVIHGENDKDFDIRDVKDVEHMFSFIIRNDWMVIEDE